MAYVALKPCCFAGQRFKIGEVVPDELIHPGAYKNLVKMQVIAEQNGTDGAEAVSRVESVSRVCLQIHAQEGALPLELTAEGLQAAVDVLTGKPGDAEAIINQMTDGDALILLHIVESRKAVKAMAETRAKALNSRESAGEQ